MKFGFAIVVLAALSVYAGEANVIRVAPIADGEVRRLRVRYEDPKHNDAWFRDKSINQQVLHKEASSSIETVIHYKGEGKARQLVSTRSEVLHNHAVATWEFTFTHGDNLVLASIDHKVKSPSGKVIRQEFFDFSDPVLGYPPNTYHPYTLELLLRCLPLKVGYKTQIYLWLAPKSLMRAIVEVEKTEIVKTPAGDIDTYVIQMMPNLEDFVGKAGRVVQPLVPKFTFWSAVKGTHPLVKYRGPLGEVNIGNAPVEIHELLSLTPPL